MSQRFSRFLAVLVAMATWWAAAAASAQPAVRFPQGTGSAIGGVYPPGTSAPAPSNGAGAAAGMGTSVPNQGAPAGTSTLGPPSFDPYANSSGGLPGYTPSVPGANSIYGGTPAAPAPLPGSNINVPLPPGTTGTTVPGGTPYGAAPGAPYTAPLPPPPMTPPALFPHGMQTQSWGGASLRFITPRLRYTWVTGADQPDALGINDFDFSAAVAFPQFLFSTQPLYVVPSFSLHLWDGPEEPLGDLPSKAYSAFADFGWGTDPSRPVSGEVGVRVGLFTDFQTMNSRSLRLLGQGLFRVQTTQTLALRGGVIWLNRNKIKLLPAGGVLWTPNAQTRFDIFFPRPKLAQRLTTLGTADLWWYLGGEYGGGAWTIERSAGFSDRVDINDLRLILGVEWGQPTMLQQGHRTGFVEVGWVTDREIVYVSTPQQNPSLQDAIMVRAGFNY